MSVVVMRDLAERRNRDRLGREHAAQAVARRTRRTELAGEIFADALAREFEQPQRRERLNRRARAVFAQTVFEALDDFVAIALRRHVDEIAHDDAADVAQAHLARDLGRRFDIRLDDRIVEILAAGELTGVDVDDGQRFGRLDHDRTTRGQLRGRLHQLRDFVVDLEIGEKFRAARIRLDALDVLRAQEPHEIAHALGFVGIVDPHVLHVGRDEIARRFVDEVHVFVQERGRGSRLIILENAVPHADQHAEVGNQFGVGDTAGGGAHDGRHAFGPDRLHHALQAVAFLGRLDLARHARVLAGRHQDQVAPGERDVRRDARALEAARLLDDLHQNVVALADLLVDRPAAAAAGDLDVADVQRRLVDVVDVEKGVAPEADVHEAGAHAGQHVLNFAFVDRTDDAFVTLDVVLGEGPVFEDRDAVLPRIARNEKVGRQVGVSRVQPLLRHASRRRGLNSASSSGYRGQRPCPNIRYESVRSALPIQHHLLGDTITRRARSSPRCSCRGRNGPRAPFRSSLVLALGQAASARRVASPKTSRSFCSATLSRMPTAR